MPEPLAIPAMLITPPSPCTVAAAPFGKVSVVMMACAAPSMAASVSAAARSGTLAVMRSCGRGSPMTPVEEEKTRLAGMPSAVATEPVTSATDLSPVLPVKALELPELTMIAAPAPAGTFIASLSWQSRTQPERVVDRVKTPAIAVPGASRTSITSLRFW